ERVVVDERDRVGELEGHEVRLLEELILLAVSERSAQLDAAELREWIADEAEAAVDLLVVHREGGRRLRIGAVVALTGKAIEAVAVVRAAAEVDAGDADVERLEERPIQHVGA